MNAKWTTAFATGAILIVLSSQAMAQPWGGRGRGQGFGRGQGMGRWTQGPTEVGQAAEPTGPATACPFGFAPRGRGAWVAPGFGQRGFGLQLGRRLGLTDEQVAKIRSIVEEARTRTMTAIKGVLTEEQAKRFEQMCPNAGRQFGRAGRGPAMQNDFAGPGGRRFQRGQERGPRMGRGPRWNEQRPEARVEPPAGRGQNRMTPPIEQRFDEMDANHDGALTREEIRTYHENMGPGRGWRRP